MKRIIRTILSSLVEVFIVGFYLTVVLSSFKSLYIRYTYGDISFLMAALLFAFITVFCSLSAYIFISIVNHLKSK